MTNFLANRTKLLTPSETLAISAKANALKSAGEDVINLSVGEPDFRTPDFVCEAAIAAIQQGKHRYTPVEGTPELKQAIIQKLKRDNQLDYQLDQIIACTGAKQAIFNLFMSVLNPGDEVLIPAPYWVSYPAMALIAEATPVVINTTFEEDFKLSPEALKKAITPKTKMLILNSPSNPTGVAYTKKELEALGEVLLQHPHVLIMSDDIYEHISWLEEGFHNIVMACPALYDRTIVINGVSKAYAMTGWRLGYAAGPKEILSVMKKLQGQSTSNPCSITQAATVAALNGDQQFVVDMAIEFKKRHDFVTTAFAEIPGFKLRPVDGAFYILPNVSEAMAHFPHIHDDVAFADFILSEAKIACVPGSAFGIKGYIRFSYALDMLSLKKAVERLQILMKKA